MSAPGAVRHIRRGSRRLRGTLLAAVGAIAIGVVAILLATGALHRVELLTVDSRFELRGAQAPPADIVVVGIDDRTFDDAPPFPFPRGLHAQVIRELVKADARLIAYDIQFTEQSPPGLEQEDVKLMNAVARARGRIVLATTEVERRGSRVRTRVLGNDRNRRSLGAEVGNAVMPADANGVVRRIHGAIDGLDSFAVVAARMGGGGEIEPVPSDGAYIDFHGPSGTLAFESFGDVLKGRVDPAAFRDKIVVVGAVAPSLQDISATSASGEELMSGPEIQAEAISTLMAGQPIQEAPGWVGTLIALALAAVAPLAALRLRALVGFFGAVGLAGAYLLTAHLLFAGPGLILPVAVPVLGLTLGAVGSLGALLVVEALERQRVRDVFSHFVDAAVVDDVLATTGDEIALGGVARECTVLFSDLRGFTTFSEGRPPDQVIEILNDYLSEMTHAILDHGGTLISFMGDGIMAVFGAPLDMPDHCDRAVEASRAMLERLEAFNARMAEQDLVAEPFRMGIGINTGRVMCGNVGSSRRLEYTAIGDTVNTCSRIEGMTKETKHPVHVAASTAAGLERNGDLVEIGDMAVRGRSSTIKLFGLPEHAPATRVSRFQPAESPAAEEVGT